MSSSRLIPNLISTKVFFMTDSLDRSLLLIVGPSGSGKTTLQNLMRDRRGYGVCVSTTTRDPRPGEVDGEHYHFVSHETFAEYDREGLFLETGTYGKNRYGLTIDSLNTALSKGQGHAVLVAEIDGFRSILFPDRRVRHLLHNVRTSAVFLMVKPHIAAGRMLRRGDMLHEDISNRICRMAEETNDYLPYMSDDRCTFLLDATMKETEAFVENVQ